MISTVAINNQSATVNQSTNSSCSSSTALNRVYWFRRRQISAEPRPHKKSTKILGFGIFMVGIVILSVSLIIGIEFPLYVSKKILKDQCILEKKHVLYENWARDTNYERINRVYFWTIDNADDFINGLSTPKFVEKGPYVYTETQRKLNVIFSNQRLSYQVWKTQTFNADLTREECGNTCTMADSVMVLNTELLQKLHHFGGWENYMKARLSLWVRSTLDAMREHQPDDDIYEYLGCVDDSCEIVTESVNISTPTATTMASLSFGAFVCMNDTNNKRTLMTSDKFVSSAGHLNTKLIKYIYNQISTATTIKTQSCIKGTSDVNSTYVWTVFVDSTEVLGLPIAFQELYNDTSSDGTIYLSRDDSLSCAVLTLVKYLHNFVSWSSVLWTLRVCETVAGSSQCEDVRDLHESVLSFLDLVVEFTGDFLLNFVTDIFKLKQDSNIVWTKKQYDLVIGYDRIMDDSDPYSVQSVDGTLDHHKSFVDAYRRSPIITVSTCLDGDTTDNNMVIREYNGIPLSPEGVYRKTNQPINGRTSNFPPSNTCRACAKSYPNSETYEVFREELQRSLKYTAEKETDIQDVRLHEFIVSDDDLRDSTSCGLINVTSIRNYPAFIGNPYYIHSDCEHVERHTQHFRRDALSYIKEEPLTGRFWEQRTRLQSSAVILPEYIGGVAKPRFKDISHVGQPLPVYWVDRRVDIVQGEIDTFESKINHLMKVSCGGLIGLTLVSALIMGLSVFVGLMSTRKNKVQPVDEEGQPAPE